MLIRQYSLQSVITFDRLGRCFRFVYIYACILLCFLYCYRFSSNKDLYESITAKRRLTGHVSADFRRRHPAHVQCRSLAKLPVLRKCNFPRN